MASGLRISRQLERRRRQRNALKWVTILGAIVALAVISYRAGAVLGQAEIRRLNAEVQRLTGEVRDLLTLNDQLQADLAAARQESQRLQERYARDVPRGDSQEILSLVNASLQKGVPADRINLMIEAAARESDCSGEPISKRFLVRTRLSQGANDAVSFASNTLTVTAEGEPAADPAGRPEAWFDPGKPVTVQFIEPGGEASAASGMLPLHHTVARDGYEYRFSVLNGGVRGFVDITAERCRLPE